MCLEYLSSQGKGFKLWTLVKTRTNISNNAKNKKFTW